MRPRRGVALFASVCLLFLGCSGTPTTALARAPVKGMVHFNGKAMPGGEIRFSVAGQPPHVFEIKNGVFEGEVVAGDNVIEVVWDKDGPPHPMDPRARLKVNVVSASYSGPASKLNRKIEPSGAMDLKFDVTSGP